MTEKEKLLKKISEYKFSAYDIALFLDTHPYNKEAIDLMNQYNHKAQELTEEYEKNYGMLTATGYNNNDKKWAWIDSPWPWEGERN